MSDAAPAPRFTDPTLLGLSREGSRWAQAGLLALAIGVVVGLLSVTVFRPGAPKGGGASVRVDGSPGFKMNYARGELKVVSATARGAELVNRSSGGQGSRLFVTPMTLPAYKGSPTGALPLSSVAAEKTIAARFDARTVRFIDEGLVNIGPNPGYQISYVAKRAGTTWYGRAAVVLPDTDGATAALLMDGQEQSGGVVVSPRAVGRQGALRRPMRSLVFVG